MGFWKDFFAKRSSTKPTTDTISATDLPTTEPESEPPAPEKPEPTYQEILDGVCQSFGTRDSVLATAAFHKMTPVDMDKPYTYISDQSPTGKYGVPEACPLPAPKTTAIKLTPFYADVYELGSDSPELASILDAAIKHGTFDDNPYFQSGEMSAALFTSLARREDKSVDEVYANLERNMFPDGKHKDSVAYDALRLGGHFVGVEGLEYKTFSDIYAYLYPPHGEDMIQNHKIDQNERERAFDAARRIYLDDPDKDLAIAILAEGWQDIIDVVQKPVSKQTVDIIARGVYGEAYDWLAASKNIDTNTESSKVEDIESSHTFFRYESPLDQETVLRETEAFDEYLSLQEKVSEWYSLLQDKDTVSEHKERIEELGDEIAEAVHSPIAFELSNDALIGNATGDMLREYRSLANIKRRCSLEYDFGPNAFLGSTVVQHDEINGTLTGWGPFEDRFDVIEEDGKRLLKEDQDRKEEEARAEAARKELEKAEAALKEVVETHQWKITPEEELA